ncbi:C2 and GRAM domain-containing protein At5g50170 [Phoenix dactylifera]|uniref:C2 and GRAM domain-containing protein At5g50170 n=1 Tax=Phoenix dactylifera TaxID=42345 RepID=A0A8B7BIP7_PHODC|nr:C2 and GRAM domain-containing protein At5g50170 [Phoenix dactylifera]
MRLYVYVLEARGLPAAKASSGGAAAAADGVYAKLKVGKHKSRTRALRGTLDPVWNQEFVFRVEDDDEGEELEVGLFREADGGGGGELLGRVRLPVRAASGEGVQTLPPTWLSLQPRHHGAQSKAKDCGKILLTLTLYGRCSSNSVNHTSPPCSSLYSSANVRELKESASTRHNVLRGTESPTMTNMSKSISVVEQTPSLQAHVGHLTERHPSKNEASFSVVSRNHDLLELSDVLSGDESNKDANVLFEDAMEIMQTREETNMPENLEGGILLQQAYMIETKDLNSFLFKPNAQFRRELAGLQGTTNYEEKPWKWECKDPPCLGRLVTYTKASTKFVKAFNAIEEQTYIKADGKNFAVLTRVSTPEVPYGKCFQVVLLYKIMPGPQLSSGEESSNFVISWNLEFNQSTVMKSIIEGTARQGLEDSYESFADLLSQYTKPVVSSELLMDKEQLLAPLQLDHQSDWRLAVEYFCSFTVVCTIFMCLYVLMHIVFLRHGASWGLEFNGLDLPDTFGELIISGILFLQGERIFNMISHFVQARLQRGSDHGVKAQGDGWLLTVALIEGCNLPSAASSGFSDPYVVFSCNGETRTSSVQLQTLDPQWNEILEFDAMQEPPSVLDVEVFDFDGPFDLAASLGHAEINFLKHSSAELADMWIPLKGKLAQTSQSKLHLRIFLDNTKGMETVKEYLTKMEKEVGRKLNIRSPHRNSTFQKLFALPPEEFLINDFSCYLKRKMPLQGRLFLSARIVGFYANLFGHKTKFFFLWEDIEDIQVIPPSFSTFGSPALQIILRSGRGLDARHGAKSQDEEGRLRFQFQSFVSFNIVSRTIMALWRTRALNIEQRAKMEEDQQNHALRSVQIEDSETLLKFEDINFSEAYSSEVPLHANLLMELFEGGNLEKKIMDKVGCLNYSVTQWEVVRSNVYERHIRYKFNRHASIFGGEAVSSQQKTPTADGNGWIVDEVMTIHNVPFGDHFRVHLRYKIETLLHVSSTSRCDVFVGIEWIRSTKFQKQITRNVCDKLAHRSKDIFELAERELLSAKAQD